MLETLLQASATNDDNLTTISSIQNLTEYHAKFDALLRRREVLTQTLSRHGKCYPPHLLERALTYEALEYSDLAIFDAYTVYLVCLKRLSEEFVTDLEAYDLDGQVWNPETIEIRNLLVDVLALLVRSLTSLGVIKDAQEKLNELRQQLEVLQDEQLESRHHQPLETLLQYTNVLRPISDTDVLTILNSTTSKSRFGLSRREIYPWSNYEPDRNSPDSLAELNIYLANIALDLEAKVTELPALDSTGNATDAKWLQLGLFAKGDLEPGQEVLREKSVLTAIRPLDAAICDACGQDLDGISFDEMQQCDGEDCDVTFCSEECKIRAVEEYHRPHIADEDEDEEADFGEEEEEEVGKEHVDNDNKNSHSNHDGDDEDEPATPSLSSIDAPFCGNTDLHAIGRPTSTSTAEWDLYFLLLTRTIAMSITQKTHPLQLKEIKYLWGDFNPLSSSSSSTSPPQHTLPFSLTHTIIYPLDFFTELSQSHPPVTPYSSFWLANFDPWILQTLYAKFRGVANAQQSTFDGEPEIAAVHLGWCLANHSCEPNVKWTPRGVRKFIVLDGQAGRWSRPREKAVEQENDENGTEVGMMGIKAGQEVFSHYTDVRLPVKERRERLMEVLGGVCRCQRCLRESGEAS